MEVLKCGCLIKDGKYILADRCKYCSECNFVKNLHPFGEERLS